MAPLWPSADSWDFAPAFEATNPVFYLNAASLLFAVILLVKLRDLRGMGRLADGAWWAGLVFAAGTGLHLFGDLTNFPEDWDHVLIHATVAMALLTFVVKGTGSSEV